jgi:hypothetical protein
MFQKKTYASKEVEKFFINPRIISSGEGLINGAGMTALRLL